MTLHKQKGRPGLLCLYVPSIDLTQCSTANRADEDWAPSWGWGGSRHPCEAGQCTAFGAAPTDSRLLQITTLMYLCPLLWVLILPCNKHNLHLLF